MATTALTLPDLMEIGFRSVTMHNFGRYLGEYQEIFNIETSEKKDETESFIGSLGLVPTIEEGEPVTYDDPPQGFDVTYEHEEWALGFQVTQRAREDDLYAQIMKIPAQIGVSLRITLEAECQNDLNNATNGSFAGGDGVALGSSAHPLWGGGTDSNVPSSPADLDSASYEQALIDIASWVDDRGKPVNMRPQKLFHHRNNNFAVDKLFGTEKGLGTADGDINPAFKGRRGITPVQLNYVVDPDAWQIQCEGHFMKFYWRVSPQFGRDNDFSTGNWRFKTRMRLSHGWSDWYGMYINTGGGS